MSDFDTALERLVADPQFRAALAVDPAGALAGYRLSPDERELLHAQVDTGAGATAERQVEQRTSKASLFGLLSPLAGVGGMGAGLAEAFQGGDSGGSSGGAGANPASAPAHAPAGTGHAEMGPAEGGPAQGGPAQGGPTDSGRAEMGRADTGRAEMGRADTGRAEMGRADTGRAEMGRAGGLGATVGGLVGTDEAAAEPAASARGTLYSSASAGSGDGAATSGLGAAFADALGPLDEAPDEPQPGTATLRPVDYRTRIDADGDGRWDRFTVTERADQGVDLVVDRDNDGRAEFVGHDFDRDGLIDEASTDSDRDGRLDTRWVDDNGDGWLDRRIPVRDPGSPPL